MADTIHGYYIHGYYFSTAARRQCRCATLSHPPMPRAIQERLDGRVDGLTWAPPRG